MSLYNLSPKYLVNNFLLKNETELNDIASLKQTKINMPLSSSDTNKIIDTNICCRIIANLILNKNYQTLDNNVSNVSNVSNICNMSSEDYKELKKYLEDNGIVGKKLLKLMDEKTRNKFISQPYYGHILYIEIVKYLLELQ